MRSAAPLSLLSLLCAAALGAGCSSERRGEAVVAPLTPQELQDPQACAPCHAAQVAEWAGSAHASAADDPVFRAMNRRGQRETGGTLGAYCVGCHAPLAVSSGATTDGQNLDDVPASLKGITCGVCHAVDSLAAPHAVGLPFAIAGDGVIRGALPDTGAPRTPAHRSAYSALVDRDQLESSSLCGGCHDLVGTQGAHVGRTFTEWRASVFADSALGTTCSQCHMPVALSTGEATARHGHGFVGVGVPLAVTAPTGAPTDAPRAAVQAGLDTVIQSALCVRQIGGVSTVQVILENVGAGHAFPSGAVPDRRMWVELRAYAGPNVILESGVPAAATVDVTTLDDPNMWLTRGCMLDGSEQPTRSVWSAADYRTNLLPALSTFDRTDVRYYQTHVAQTYPRAVGATLAQAPDRVTMGLRFAPVGLDVLDDLIGSGDLDPAVRDRAAIFTIGRDLEWTPDGATESFRDGDVPTSCVSTTGLVASADKVPAAPACAATATSEPPAAPPPSGRVTCAGDPHLDVIGAGLDHAGAQGLFRVALRAAVPARAENTWTIDVRTMAGDPVVGAVVGAQARMRDHGHAPPDPPVVTAGAEAGEYVVSPLHFFLPGVWRATFTINLAGKTDTVTFDFCVEG